MKFLLEMLIYEGSKFQMESKMGISLIMHQVAVTISPDISVFEASQIMKEQKFGALVVSTGSDIQGIFTERDVLFKIISDRKNPDTTRVADVMTRDVITFDLENEPESALKIMQEKAIRHLPIVDENKKIVGMLGVRDLMNYMLDKLELENESLNSLLEGEGITP